MSDPFPAGRWLLIDAAGPELITGLFSEDRWLASHRTTDGFIESMQPSVRTLLEASSLHLPDLAGAVCATGPGSTLGLRLSALFLRSLLALPSLAHWECRTYSNLAAAGCSLVASGESGSFTLAAPWRRNRLHLASFESGPPVRFTFGYRDHKPGEPYNGNWVALGNRTAAFPRKGNRIPYPAERLPALLAAFPEILEPASRPAPLQFENPAFAPWNGERHART